MEQSLDKIGHTLDKPHNPDFEEDATERERDEVLEQLGNSELVELLQVNAALNRVDQGEFGMCAACGEDISPERLEVVPHKQKCRRCA